ncbi:MULTISPECIES: hypothetical protein [Streptomyces]|uniref:hypothetical protein n=1 Tax=Streptomyces TaxID=1883 RepID=UPI0030F19D3D
MAAIRGQPEGSGQQVDFAGRLIEVGGNRLLGRVDRVPAGGHAADDVRVGSGPLRHDSLELQSVALVSTGVEQQVQAPGTVLEGGEACSLGEPACVQGNPGQRHESQVELPR